MYKNIVFDKSWDYDNLCIKIFEKGNNFAKECFIYDKKSSKS